jgi:tetratricopeptide (TPR) repeat protein
VSETKAGQSSADGVTKPAKANEAVYFDSPGGKILENLPTPSMDAKRGAGESIIVVKNAGSKKTAVKKESSKTVITTSTTQESRVVAANRALRLGRYDAALDIYNQLYKDNPRDGRILMGRAVALQKLGQIPEAIEAYESVLDMDSDNPEAIVNLMGLIRKEYPAVALEKLLGLQERHPKNPAIIAQLGIAYADAGNLEQATATLNRAVILEPNNAQHYFNLAVIAERMKDRPRAIELYERALETDAVYGSGRAIDRNMIYDRLTRIRG